MKHKYISLKAVAFMTALLVSFMALPTMPAHAYGQYIYITPQSGPTGTQVSVYGASFTPSVLSENTSVEDVITFAKTYFPDKTTLVQTTAIDYWGEFETSFTIGEYPAGSYKVWVYDQSASRPVWVSAKFVIEPEVKLSKTSGYVGDNITISGTGFASSSNITVHFGSLIIAGTSTNQSGSFDAVTVSVPDSAGAVHTVIAVDEDGNQTELDFTTVEHLSISPVSGVVGEEITIRGTGFLADKDIGVNFNGVALITSPAVVKTGPTGNFTGKFSIPHYSASSYVVEASDGTGSASTSLDITFGGELSRTLGYIGSRVTYRGAGFVPGKVAVISYDEAPLSERTVGEHGKLTAVFDIPASLEGGHVVRISDGFNSANYTFNVMSSAVLNVNRQSGYVGCDIVLEGEGFIQGKVADISYDDIRVTEADVDETGAFSAVFEVPPGIAGEHGISVSDGFNSVNATFLMESVPPPTPYFLLPGGAVKSIEDLRFIWADVNDPSGVTYSLQVAADASFIVSDNMSAVILSKTGLTDTEYIPRAEEIEGIDKEATYYWRVRAIDRALNVGEWSKIQVFHFGGGGSSWLIVSFVAEGGLLSCLTAFWIIKRKRKRTAGDKDDEDEYDDEDDEYDDDDEDDEDNEYDD
jgi:hypothetical protein